MKINRKELMVGKDRDELINHLVISALTNTIGTGSEFAKFVEEKWDDQDEIEIKFSVQGVELDIEKVCDEWEQQMDRLIAEKAHELVQEKFRPIDNLLHGLEKEIKKKSKEELGLELDEYDW